MKVLVIAPHPDDEILGCGGLLLKRHSEGSEVAWLIMTSIHDCPDFTQDQISRRSAEIELVQKSLSIQPQNLFQLKFSPAKLDQIPLSTLVDSVSSICADFEPNEILIPHPSDIHSDHRATFEAASSCTKWFRYPSVKKVLAYETISETNFSICNHNSVFTPNYFVDISPFLTRKLDIMSVYKSELGLHPFPRSLKSIEALATLRGSQMGALAAEAFHLLRQSEF